MTTARVPTCAVIVPTYNGAALTATCVQALLANPPARAQWTIVVVDDGSSDGTLETLRRFSGQIEVVAQGRNTGFARACNAGARAAGDCDYLVFLNNDTLPVAGWLDALVREAESDQRVAAVGAKLLFPNGQVQHAGVIIGQDGWPHHLYAGFDGEHPAVNRSREVRAATAACLLVRRSDFEQLGGFDPVFHNGYEDVDFCLRAGRAGRTIRYCADSVVYHLESVTRWPSGSPEPSDETDRVYRERWGANATPDDLQHYLADGLLAFSYGMHYPLTLEVSPQLAVVDRDGEEPAGLERLLGVRSRQVMELVAAQSRQMVRGAAPTVPPPLAARGKALRGRRVADGRRHRLGAGEPGHLLSIVIPVKNGEPDLAELLPLILGQSISAELEIVAVDSGSTDGTIALLERFGATVLAIEPDEFDHGLTRNLLAEQAGGDVLVFLSQSARPDGDRWLAPLVAGLDEDPSVAGACSRVVPHATADILTRRDVERELSGSTERRRTQISDWTLYNGMSAGERRVFLNFHTVSAAIRAEAWRQTPFRSVRTLGEDLLWAREVVESGWAIVHEPASVVHHSHAYALGELFARNVDDGIANRDIVERTFASGEVVPLIQAMARDDWYYLRDTLGLSGDELEHWQLESVLRRVAQAAGQWLGTNYETLPAGTAASFSSVAQSRAGRSGRRS